MSNEIALNNTAATHQAYGQSHWEPETQGKGKEILDIMMKGGAQERSTQTRSQVSDSNSVGQADQAYGQSHWKPETQGKGKETLDIMMKGGAQERSTQTQSQVSDSNSGGQADSLIKETSAQAKKVNTAQKNYLDAMKGGKIEEIMAAALEFQKQTNLLSSIQKMASKVMEMIKSAMDDVSQKIK